MNYNISTDDLLARFLKCIQIDSETGDEKEMAEFLYQELVDLGLEVEKIDVPDWVGSNGFNLHGILKGDDSKDSIFFSSHMDTVTPGLGIRPEVCPDGYVRSDGSTILGGDDKAGICAILEALKQAKQAGNHPTIEVVFTVREESGLLGAKSFDNSKLISSRGVVLDSGGGPNQIITAAPGENDIHVVVTGKRSHAGVAPELGISAIQVAATAVAEMNLLRIDHETTCNIGTFVAEGPTNIVSPEAKLEFEVRSRNGEKLKAQTEHMVSVLEKTCEKFGTSCQIEVEPTYQSFHLPDDHPLVTDIMAICREMGLEPETVGSGGGSDANIFNAKGVDTVNLGVGMEQVHTTKEQLNLEHFYQASEVCYRLMTK